MRALGVTALLILTSLIGFGTIPLACAPFGSNVSDEQSDASLSEGGALGEGGDAGKAYRDLILADGPVGYWRLGDRVNSVVVADESSGGHPGSPIACTLGVFGAIAGDPDTAALFDKAESVIKLGRAFDFHDRTPFSVEAWIAPKALTGFHHFFSKESGNNGRQGFALLIDKGIGIVFERWVDGSQKKVVTPGLPSLESFTHVAGTYDGTSLSLFVDGLQIATVLDERPLQSQDGDAVIGAASPNGNAFAGTIDEVAIYDKALPPDRISAHYAAGKHP